MKPCSCTMFRALSKRALGGKHQTGTRTCVITKKENEKVYLEMSLEGILRKIKVHRRNHTRYNITFRRFNGMSKGSPSQYFFDR